MWWWSLYNSAAGFAVCLYCSQISYQAIKHLPHSLVSTSWFGIRYLWQASMPKTCREHSSLCSPSLLTPIIGYCLGFRQMKRYQSQNCNFQQMPVGVGVLMCPQVFPHRLAALLDNEISQRDKVALANHFCSLKMCCLDTFSTRLRKYMEVWALIHVMQHLPMPP